MLDLEITGVKDPKEFSTTKTEDNDDMKTDDFHQGKHIIESSKLKPKT